MTIRPINNKLSGMKTNRVNLDSVSHHPKVWHLPDWNNSDDNARISVLREIAERSGVDPRFATLAINICKEAGVEPRDYKGQARSILKWVQQTIYYINEPAERLQDPIYTLKVGYGDCDDMAILLATLYESIRLEWRYVLSGKVNGKLDRWIEGTPIKKGGTWSHIYLLVGYPPFKPHKWVFAEPTLRGVELGWDIIQSMNQGENVLPEMGSVNESGILVINDKRKEKREKRKKILARWREKLDPETLVSDVMIIAITSVLTTIAISKIKQAVNLRK